MPPYLNQDFRCRDHRMFRHIRGLLQPLCRCGYRNWLGCWRPLPAPLLHFPMAGAPGVKWPNLVSWPELTYRIGYDAVMIKAFQCCSLNRQKQAMLVQ